ncbi:MAG: tetratricopeptide repeat protein [Deltaproteobacteria bacterium]|jgi:predicted O-linked N-acetylglucosamine transferase (SPINDLY family)|nr:tetratricopeptide repeat protein [Deltaproteobacteria bacterium]
MAKISKKIKRSLGQGKKRKKTPPLQKTFQQALTLHQAGRLPQAEALYRQVLAAEPDHPDALHYLGILAHQVGKHEIAVELINKALILKPDSAEAHLNLGNALKDQGKLDEAAASYRSAITLQPHNANTHLNLGNTFLEQGKLVEAAGSYRQAITLQPDFADAYYNLGITLKAQAKLEEAVVSYRQAITLQPDNPNTHLNLGNTLLDQGKLDEAEASYQRALDLKPDFAMAHYNLGNVYKEQYRLGEAVASYHKALTFQPDYADAILNLGNALKDQGRLDEAIASYRRVLAMEPYYVQAHSNLLFCLNYFSGVTQEEIYNESLHWAERFARFCQTDTPTFANILKTDRKLRVGYVSPDFRVHSVAFFIGPIIREHNRERIEVFCYANVKKPDTVTERLQAEADHYSSTDGIKPEAVADSIKNDRIDILVDLAGHTNNNNLPVFARKPAPVQVTWLGYPNTTGLRYMDYRLTDAIADPEGEADKLHSERLLRLEHGFLCYQPLASAPEVAPSPCREHGQITFASFNNLTKVTPEVIKVWAEILHAVPDSRLLLKATQLADDHTRDRIGEMFVQEGIGPERLEMHSRLPNPADHLELYSMVDIGLDPFPYNGTTTTCEALWMGVPVVTLLGNRHAGRVGASILHRTGLEELIARSVDGYIKMARSLAGDLERLQEMRFSLRSRLQESELMNSRLFTDHLEDVYLQIWRKYCESMRAIQ